MEVRTRIEAALRGILAVNESVNGVACGPPGFANALQYAVFPGGARIRPRLCLAVAEACGDDNPAASACAAATIELLHCASLVHDDLPCFDDADLRRGKPSVHKAFGERLAVLVGDELIVLAFEALGRMGTLAPQRAVSLLSILGRAVGGPHGIIAGQAWECEPVVDLTEYQRAKTGSLFAAATMAGAAAAGDEPTKWSLLGFRLGEAFQVADDIRDVVADAAEIGKPIGQDAALGRPSAVERYGLMGAVQHLEQLIADALERVPPCRGAAGMREVVLAAAATLLPKHLASCAA